MTVPNTLHPDLIHHLSFSSSVADSHTVTILCMGRVRTTLKQPWHIIRNASTLKYGMLVQVTVRKGGNETVTLQGRWRPGNDGYATFFITRLRQGTSDNPRYRCTAITTVPNKDIRPVPP